MWNKEKIDYLHWIKFTRKLYQLQQPTQTPMKTNWNNANITDTHTHTHTQTVTELGKREKSLEFDGWQLPAEKWQASI